MITSKVHLPAATSENVEVRIRGYDTAPPLVEWASALSTEHLALESGAPSEGDFAAATVVNRGTTSGPWSVQVRISGLQPGTYGLWIRATSGSTAPIRFAGQIVLY